MEMINPEIQKAILFAEWCGIHADYLPEIAVWICYEGENTVKKTTSEMFKDYENAKNLLGFGETVTR